MSSDGPLKWRQPLSFWRHCTYSSVYITCLNVFHLRQTLLGKHQRQRCRLVSKGLYGVGKHVYWCTDFTIVAIAVHASHEVGHAVQNASCCTGPVFKPIWPISSNRASRQRGPTAFLVYWQKREKDFFFAKRLGLQLLWSSTSVICLNVD